MLLFVLFTGFNCLDVFPASKAKVEEKIQQLNFNEQDVDEYTKLHRAILAGSYEEVKALIFSGVKIHTKNSLALAIKSKNIEIEALLQIHIDLLHKAWAGDFKDVMVALSSGVFVDVKDEVGQTLLWHATSQKKEDIVQLLLAKKANPDVQSDDGTAPLHMAAYFRDIAIVTLLLNAKANPNIQDVRRQTPLHQAAYSSYFDSYKTCSIFFEKGTHPEHVNCQNVVKLLLKKGANPDIQDESENTPLHTAVIYATHEEKMSVVQQLVDAGADKALRNNLGHTALGHAQSYYFAVRRWRTDEGLSQLIALLQD